jgi:hypothetical protein
MIETPQAPVERPERNVAGFAGDDHGDHQASSRAVRALT